MAQMLLGIRVIWRMIRTTGGERIIPVERNEGMVAKVARSSSKDEQVSIIVPVLNERMRLAPCLDGLIAQGEEVAEIIVVDGGSDDGTQELVSTYFRRVSRVCLVDSNPL